MIRINDKGNLVFETKQDLIDYVMSNECCFGEIDKSDSPYYCEYYPDESDRKMYITVFDHDKGEPIIEWCCEDQSAMLFNEDTYEYLEVTDGQ